MNISIKFPQLDANKHCEVPEVTKTCPFKSHNWINILANLQDLNKD